MADEVSAPAEQTMGRRSFLRRALGALGFAAATTITTPELVGGERKTPPQAAVPTIPVGTFPTDVPQPIATEARFTTIPTPMPTESPAAAMTAPTPEINQPAAAPAETPPNPISTPRPIGAPASDPTNI